MNDVRDVFTSSFHLNVFSKFLFLLRRTVCCCVRACLNLSFVEAGLEFEFVHAVFLIGRKRLRPRARKESKRQLTGKNENEWGRESRK